MDFVEPEETIVDLTTKPLDINAGPGSSAPDDGMGGDGTSGDGDGEGKGKGKGEGEGASGKGEGKGEGEGDGGQSEREKEIKNRGVGKGSGQDSGQGENIWGDGEGEGEGEGKGEGKSRGKGKGKGNGQGQGEGEGEGKGEGEPEGEGKGKGKGEGEGEGEDEGEDENGPEGDEKFISSSVELLESIMASFRKKETLNIHCEDEFIECHLDGLAKKHMRILKLTDHLTYRQINKFNKRTRKYIDTLDKMVLKSILLTIKYNPYAFDPSFGFATILYQCFSSAQVEEMRNTVFIGWEKFKTTVYYSDNVFTVHIPHSNILHRIEFNNDKTGFAKFELWDNRTIGTNLKDLYLTLTDLVHVKNAYIQDKSVIEYPETNITIGNIFLKQLKALNDAI